jgi:hypothetical protein
MVKNASDYTLLAGEASIYVNGSFVSGSDVPVVCPQESVYCPLGYVFAFSPSPPGNAHLISWPDWILPSA